MVLQHITWNMFRSTLGCRSNLGSNQSPKRKYPERPIQLDLQLAFVLLRIPPLPDLLDAIARQNQLLEKLKTIKTIQVDESPA